MDLLLWALVGATDISAARRRAHHAYGGQCCWRFRIARFDRCGSTRPSLTNRWSAIGVIYAPQYALMRGQVLKI
jgi:hypothetical protein